MSHGWVYLNGQHKPFRQWREVRKWKGVERVAVIVRKNGHDEEVIVDETQVKRFPKEVEK